jgi:Ca-activated chloride channel family protein
MTGFGVPALLGLLAVPALLLALICWRITRRRIDLRRLTRDRTVPFRSRFGFGGELVFWLSVVIATASFVVALARPQAALSTPRPAGIDIVILQDGSASMHVKDEVLADGRAGDRWQRSMEFLRRLGDALSWRDDRIAMTAFAHIAAPQIRLTRDPNTYFFFLDHLHSRSPFRLEDDTTWDTNLELGIDWGLRIVSKDEELRGRSPNAKLFIMLSDGEAWSGEVAKAIERVRQRGVPVDVIGVGSLAGGPLPVVKGEDGLELPIDGPRVSRLDRDSLRRIASAAGGGYYELDRDADTAIARSIVGAGRRLAPPVAATTETEDLYWWFLAAGWGVLAVGMVFLREPTELFWLLGGVGTTALILGPMIW